MIRKWNLKRVAARTNGRALCVTLLLIFGAGQNVAQALVLGNLELRSYLNQPLDAVIPLSFVKPGELDSLTLNIKGPGGGLADVLLEQNVRIEIVDEDGNQPYLHILSKTPVREPALTFILELVGDNGRISREYSLILDPKL